MEKYIVSTLPVSNFTSATMGWPDGKQRWSAKIANNFVRFNAHNNHTNHSTTTTRPERYYANIVVSKKKSPKIKP